MVFKSDNTYYDDTIPPGVMTPRLLSDCPTAPAPTFTPPKGSTRKFNYWNNTSNPPCWQNVDDYNRESPMVDWYKFTHWTCDIGNRRYNLRQGDPLSVHVFNIDEPPVMTLCAYWERAYDKISFYVGD